MPLLQLLVHPGRHVTWYGDDTQRIRAIAILNALLGSWGRRGGFYRPAKYDVPSAKIPKYPIEPKRAGQTHSPANSPLQVLRYQMQLLMLQFLKTNRIFNKRVDY